MALVAQFQVRTLKGKQGGMTAQVDNQLVKCTKSWL